MCLLEIVQEKVKRKMLENQIEIYENKVYKTRQQLLYSAQPLINNFCKQYELTFTAGMGSFSFNFSKKDHSDSYIYEEFLDELNPELFALLNYQLEDHNALGTSLENYTQQVSEFVYIYRDNNTDKLTIHKEPTDLVSITNYGDMSLKLANTVLERPDAVELLNFY